MKISNLSSYERTCWCLAVMALTCTAVGADLPQAVPAAIAPDWVNNPAGAFRRLQADFVQLQRDYDALRTAAGWAGWVAGGLLTLLGFVRMIPGPTNAIGNMLWAMFSTKLQKLADGKQQIMAEGFIGVAEVMRTFPRDTPLGEVLDKLELRLSPEVKKAYSDWEKGHADKRPPSRAELARSARIQAEAIAEVEAETSALTKNP